MSMHRIIDTTKETLRKSFLLLEGRYRRERRLLCAVIYTVGFLIVLVIFLAAYIAIQNYIDKLHGQTLRYVADVDRKIQIDEIFVRRTGNALGFYWSDDHQDLIRLSHSVEALRSSDSVVIDLSLRKTRIQLIMPSEVKDALGTNWEYRARALQSISGAAMSTLEAIGIRRQGYVIGVERDFAAFFPAAENGPLGERNKASVGNVIREKRKIVMKRSAFVDKRHDVQWTGPYVDDRSGAMMLSCFGVLKNEKTGPVLYGGDVSADYLLNKLEPDGERFGAIGLFNQNAELIKHLGGDSWFTQSAGVLMKSGRTTGVMWRAGGVFLAEPVHGEFGVLIYGIRYVTLVKAVAAQLFWIGGIGGALLVMLFGFAYNWFSRLLQRNYVEERRALEGEMLNHVLVSATPIGLCIIRKSDFTVMKANTRAISLLDMHESMTLPAEVITKLCGRCAVETTDVEMAEASRLDVGLPSPTGSSTRYLNINYAESEYNNNAMLFCAIIDVDEQKSAEIASRKSKEELERLLRARSYFFAAMSHEIRTPLNVIVGNLEVLAGEICPDPMRDRIDAMSSASESLLRVVKDVTDLSKISSGEMELAPVHFSPLECLESAAKMYSEVLFSKGVGFYLLVNPDAERIVVGDAGRISQVVSNLLGNAFRFTQSGKVVLRGGLVSDGSGSAELEIVVADSGIGMDEEFLSCLFDPFFQGHEGAPGRFGGRGFGLSICAMLCRLMGGSIEAKSIKHVGSVFTVRLPVILAGETKNALNESHGRVVLIASVPEVARTLVAWLAHWGWNVVASHKERPGMNDVLPYSVDVIVLFDDDPASAAEFAATAPAPVLLVRQGGPQWPVRLTSHLVEVSAFHTHALHDALQWMCNGMESSRMPVASGEKLNVKKSYKVAGESGERLTALIAEDDEFSRKVLSDQVSSFGLQTVIACDGNEVLAILEGRSVDIVLTDLDMPGIGWVDFIHVMKEKWPSIPVVAVSASEQDIDIERGLALGFHDYIAKPVTIKRLSHVLERIFSEDLSLRDSLIIARHEFDPIQKGSLWIAFGKQSEGEFEKLATVLADRNGRELGRWMHRMRGTLLVLGCKEPTAQCLDIEKKAESGLVWDDALIEATERVCSRIRELIVENTPPGMTS